MSQLQIDLGADCGDSAVATNKASVFVRTKKVHPRKTECGIQPLEAAVKAKRRVDRWKAAYHAERRRSSEQQTELLAELADTRQAYRQTLNQHKAQFAKAATGTSALRGPRVEYCNRVIAMHDRGQTDLQRYRNTLINLVATKSIQADDKLLDELNQELAAVQTKLDNWDNRRELGKCKVLVERSAERSPPITAASPIIQAKKAARADARRSDPTTMGNKQPSAPLEQVVAALQSEAAVVNETNEALAETAAAKAKADAVAKAERTRWRILQDDL